MFASEQSSGGAREKCFSEGFMSFLLLTRQDYCLTSTVPEYKHINKLVGWEQPSRTPYLKRPNVSSVQW